MSFFSTGDRYRDQYLIENVIPFFQGELALARSGDQRYYLQYVRLKKQAPPRAIQQYLNLDHPLVLPHLQVFTEERSLVFIHPHVELRPLSEVIANNPASEEQLIKWARSLLELEALLARQPLPMYLFLHPHNLGITEDGQLKVMFCGVYKVTELESSLNWGTLFYSLLTGEVLDKPLTKLPEDAPVSKLMARVIQRGLKNPSVDKILAQIDTYERKKNSKGLFSRFKKEEKVAAPDPVENKKPKVQEEERTSPKGKGSNFWLRLGFSLLLAYACVSSTIAWMSNLELLNASKEEPAPTVTEEKLDLSAQVFIKNFAREYFLWSEGNEEARKERLAPYLASDVDEQAGFSFENLKWNSWARNVEIWSMETDRDQITALVYAETQMQNIEDPEKERRVERWMEVNVKKSGKVYVVTEVPKFTDSPFIEEE